MSERPWIIPVVAVVLLLGVIVFVRRGVQLPPEDESESSAAVHVSPHVRPVERARAHGDEFASSGAPIAAAHDDERAPRPAIHPVGTPRAIDPAAHEEVADAATPGGGATVVKAKMSLSFDGSTTGADGTAPIRADGVESDQSLGATRFMPQAVVIYPDSGGIDPSAGTLAFWVHMEWDPTQPERRSKTLAELRAGGWNNRIELNLGPPVINCLFTNSDGVEQSVGTGIAWQLGEWHHVAVTWGDSIGSFYIDGVLRDQRELVGTMDIPPGTPLYVGSTYNAPLRPGQGAVSLRGWEVFQDALSPDDISALMIQTAPAAG